MNRSSKYNFYLPQNTDPMSVSDFNANFETIDSKLLTKEQTLTSTEKAAIRTNAGLGGAALRSVANNLTTEESGSVLDARQGKALNDKINTLHTSTGMTSTTVATITVPNVSAHMIVITSTAASRAAVLIVNCNASGVIAMNEVFSGNGISFSTSTNTITVTCTAATSIRISGFCFNGDPITAEKTS